MASLYWDDFERRINETVVAVKQGIKPPVRRVAVFITDKCNFRCKYCNHGIKGNTLPKEAFLQLLEKYGNTAIIHITGGEPSTVPWLYPLLEERCNEHRFHLNTNAYITPPAKAVKRLKISLDHHNPDYWNPLVGRRDAYKMVVHNIKQATAHTIVSITCTLTKDNYTNAVNFARFVKKEFKGLYALFFSVYKGDNPAFAMSNADAEMFFETILPELRRELPPESLELINETIDEKKRIMQGVRFPQNNDKICYISMSEKVITPEGKEFTCSHLYRDKIHFTEPHKHTKCLYGCNRRLVMFNEKVKARLKYGF